MPPIAIAGLDQAAKIKALNAIVRGQVLRVNLAGSKGKEPTFRKGYAPVGMYVDERRLGRSLTGSMSGALVTTMLVAFAPLALRVLAELISRARKSSVQVRIDGHPVMQIREHTTARELDDQLTKSIAALGAAGLIQAGGVVSVAASQGSDA